MEDMFKFYIKPLVKAMIADMLDGIDTSTIGTLGNCIFSGNVVTDYTLLCLNDSILNSSGRKLHVGDLYLNVDN